MTSRARSAGESPLWLSGVLLLAVMVVVDLVLGRQINGAYAGAAILTGIYADARRTALVAGSRSCWRTPTTVVSSGSSARPRWRSACSTRWRWS